MTEKMIRDAYCRIRTIDQTIPDDVLDFMKNAALEKLKLRPIELPSDEEIDDEATHYIESGSSNSFRSGAKWLRDRISLRTMTTKP